MSNSFTIDRSAPNAGFWTPWGPQAIAPASPKLATLRRRLEALGQTKRSESKLEDDYSSKPECSYDP